MSVIHNCGQPLDSRQLRAFVALAKTRSFTTAGKEIGISQSAISHSVKALEGDLDCCLLSRTSKKVHLTPSGEHLLHYAQKILNDMTVTRESMARLRAWGQSKLRIGANSCIARHFLPSVLEDFWREMKDLPVTVEMAGPDLCIDLLNNNRIDVAISLHPNRSADMHITPLFVDEIRWVVSAEHPWAIAGKVDRDQIGAQAIVTCSRTCPSFGAIESYFAREAHQLKVVYEAGDMDALKHHVQQGHAAALLAPWVIREELSARKLVVLPLGRRPLRRQWCQFRSATARMGFAEETFQRQAVYHSNKFVGTHQPSRMAPDLTASVLAE